MSEPEDLHFQIFNTGQRGVDFSSGANPDSTGNSFQFVSTREGYEPNVVTDTQQHIDRLLSGYHDLQCPFCNQVVVEPPACAA